jgi:hypothetical protein
VIASETINRYILRSRLEKAARQWTTASAIHLLIELIVDALRFGRGLHTLV